MSDYEVQRLGNTGRFKTYFNGKPLDGQTDKSMADARIHCEQHADWQNEVVDWLDCGSFLSGRGRVRVSE